MAHLMYPTEGDYPTLEVVHGATDVVGVEDDRVSGVGPERMRRRLTERDLLAVVRHQTSQIGHCLVAEIQEADDVLDALVLLEAGLHELQSNELPLLSQYGLWEHSRRHIEGERHLILRLARPHSHVPGVLRHLIAGCGEQLLGSIPDAVVAGAAARRHGNVQRPTEGVAPLDTADQPRAAPSDHPRALAIRVLEEELIATPAAGHPTQLHLVPSLHLHLCEPWRGQHRACQCDVRLVH